jgi:D-glycero-D-manno-heptose 1,7-bisphosphate phosphatase
MNPPRAVFLDRDGVINGAIVRGGRPHPPSSPAELEILPGVPAAVAELRGAGYMVIVVTNQPDVAKGVQTRAAVEAIHEQIVALVPVDDIRICYHDDRDGCACRKPRPGMLLEAAARWSIDLERSYMVGDRWRDVGAGRAAGCRTILVGDGYGEPMPERAHAVVASLAEASALIVSRRI